MAKKISDINFLLQTDDITQHRYASIDDFWDPVVVDGKRLAFSTVVGDMGNPDYNFLVLIHALTEQYLCYRHGISDEQITGFDTSPYGSKLDDPGHSRKAPYHKEHEVGTKVEKIVCEALGVDWRAYEGAIDRALIKWKKKQTSTK